jgi:hypothetical protein
MLEDVPASTLRRSRFSDFEEMVDRAFENFNSVAELEKAVGSWPWRIKLVQASSEKPISRKMTLLLALVIFKGYELFPAHDATPHNRPE